MSNQVWVCPITNAHGTQTHISFTGSPGAGDAKAVVELLEHMRREHPAAYRVLAAAVRFLAEVEE